MEERLTVTPHHSHRMPARHSDDQHVFLQETHFELAGKFPSLQWWKWTTVNWRQKQKWLYKLTGFLRIDIMLVRILLKYQRQSLVNISYFSYILISFFFSVNYWWWWCPIDIVYLTIIKWQSGKWTKMQEKYEWKMKMRCWKDHIPQSDQINKHQNLFCNFILLKWETFQHLHISGLHLLLIQIHIHQNLINNISFLIQIHNGSCGKS